MLFSFTPGRSRDMEDSLRSLGAILDALRASSVLIRESPRVLILRAQVAVPVGDRVEGGWRSIDRMMSADDLLRYRQEAIARRGTGHLAGRYERSLRMIGRHIDEGGLEMVTLIQHRTATSWVLWHGTSLADGPTLLVLEDDQLLVGDSREADSRVARQRAEAIAMEVAHSRGR